MRIIKKKSKACNDSMGKCAYLSFVTMQNILTFMQNIMSDFSFDFWLKYDADIHYCSNWF